MFTSVDCHRCLSYTIDGFRGSPGERQKEGQEDEGRVGPYKALTGLIRPVIALSGSCGPWEALEGHIGLKVHKTLEGLTSPLGAL